MKQTITKKTRHSLPISSNVTAVSHHRRSLKSADQRSSTSNVQSIFTNFNAIKSINKNNVTYINDRRDTVLTDIWPDQLNSSTAYIILSAKKSTKNSYGCHGFSMRIVIPFICAVLIFGGILCAVLFPLLKKANTATTHSTSISTILINPIMNMSITISSNTGSNTNTSSTTSITITAISTATTTSTVITVTTVSTATTAATASTVITATTTSTVTTATTTSTVTTATTTSTVTTATTTSTVTTATTTSTITTVTTTTTESTTTTVTTDTTTSTTTTATTTTTESTTTTVTTDTTTSTTTTVTTDTTTSTTTTVTTDTTTSTTTSVTTDTTTSTTTTVTTDTTTTSTTTTVTTDTTTTSISTTTTTTTTTTPTPVVLTSTSEVIYPIWNTTAGSNSNPSTSGLGIGSYYPSEPYQNIFDKNTATKYTHFGHCGVNISSSTCGVGTGVYVTLQRGASLLVAVQFCTANNIPERDPLTVTIEGSNQPSSALTFGSSWTLIYNGSTGLSPDPGRFAGGTVQYISNNMISYGSYRVIITSKRYITNSIQYSEVQLLGY